MRRVAVFVDAGYFWVQSIKAIDDRADKSTPLPRAALNIDYQQLRKMICETEIKKEFPDAHLLRVYWYDGPGKTGSTIIHEKIANLDDFKLRLGTRNFKGTQKAVDGLIIADLISLAQNKAISDAIIVSGDADLTPGMVAAQALGVRVHLLEMGSPKATSPYLKAEADRVIRWGCEAIKGFSTASKTHQLWQPAPMTHNTERGADETNTEPTRRKSQTPKTPPSAPVKKEEVDSTRAETIAAAVLQTIGEEMLQTYAEQIDSAHTLPQEIDKLLLQEGRKACDRRLKEEEKRAIRRVFRDKIKKEAEEFSFKTNKDAHSRDMETVVDTVLQNINNEILQAYAEQIDSAHTLPQEIDKLLLQEGRKVFDRQLEEREKRAIRRAFKDKINVAKPIQTEPQDNT